MATLNDTQKVYGPFVSYSNTHPTLIIQANGGSVAFEVLADDGADTWITVETFTEDGAHKVEVGATSVRLTPSGGAKFAFIGRA